MREKKKHYLSVIETVCVYGLSFFCIGVLVLIFYYNIRMTSYLVKWEVTYFVKDNLVLNIFILVSFVLLLYILCRSTVLKKLSDWLTNDIHYKILRNILLIGISSIALFWVLSTQYIPGVDEGEIQEYAYRLITGDKSIFMPGEYMNKNRSNWGFFIYVYFLAYIFGGKNYIIYEIINSIAIGMIYKQFVEMMTCRQIGRQTQIGMLVLGVLFFPLQAYSIMVYGNILGMAMAFTAMKYEMLFFKNYKGSNVILCALFISAAVFLKSNMAIYLIAILIYAAIEMIIKFHNKILLLIGAILLCVELQSVTAKCVVENLSGYEMENPYSYWSFIAMGLQDSTFDPEFAPGWWNEYILESYEESGHNTSAQGEIAKESIKGSLKKFIADPFYAFDFFSKKLSSTWANPSFQCFATVRNGSHIEVPEWVYRLLSYPGQYIATSFYHILVLITLFGSLMALVLTFNNRELFIDNCIFPMIVVGGFFFHLFWETKARYALLYFVALIPYACMGYSLLCQRWTLKNTNEKSGTGHIFMPIKRNGYVIFLMVIFFILLVGIYAGTKESLITENTEDYYKYLEEQKLIDDVVKNDDYVIYSLKGQMDIPLSDDSGNKKIEPLPISVFTHNGESFLYQKEKKQWLSSVYEDSGEIILSLTNHGNDQSRWVIRPSSDNRFAFCQGDNAITYDTLTGKLYLRSYTGSFNQLWKLAEREEKNPVADDNKLGIILSEQAGHIADTLHEIKDINIYLSYLKQYEDIIDIYIAVQDIQGYCLTKDIMDKLETLGISQADALLEHEYHSFIAAICKGNPCIKQIGGDEKIYDKYKTENGINIELKSATLHYGNLAEILIDGIDYAVKGRGLNLVVLDSQSGALLDSVNFDTHEEGIPCQR